jgi:hypothetical protein
MKNIHGRARKRLDIPSTYVTNMDIFLCVSDEPYHDITIRRILVRSSYLRPVTYIHGRVRNV